MPFFHLLDQIIKQRFCNFQIICRQRCAIAQQFILFNNGFGTCRCFCKLFRQYVLGRNDDKTSAFTLKNTGNTEIPHIHIAVIQEIVGFLIVVFASFCDFLFVKGAFSGCCGSTFSQIEDVIDNFAQIIARIGGMSPKGKFNSAEFRRTGSFLQFKHDCQKPS